MLTILPPIFIGALIINVDDQCRINDARPDRFQKVEEE
jgi:hypothetical protein